MLLVGGVFMVLFGGRLLPARASAEGRVRPTVASASPGEELVRGYGVGDITRLRVLPRLAAGRRFAAAAQLRREYGANVVASGAGGRPARMRRLPRTTEAAAARRRARPAGTRPVHSSVCAPSSGSPSSDPAAGPRPDSPKCC
jgi:hypothetical protein